ncbi:MAG: ABC-2 family transporter protein [Elusimicrobiales bacterium]
MIFFWGLLFHNFGTSLGAGGVHFSEVMLLFAIASSSFGLFNIFFGGAQKLSQIIISGQLDVFLLYPKDPLFMSIISKSSLAAWGDLLFGCILAFAVLPRNISSALAFIYFSGVATIILASFSVIINSLTFYLGNAQEIHRTALMGLLSFSSYPETVFSGATKVILFSFLPVGLYLYLPLRAILRLDIASFALSSGIAAVFLLTAWLVFRGGIKRFESGNLIYFTK